MTEAEQSFDDARLAAIEELPIEQRAAAYLALHDELQAELEGGDEAPRLV